MQAFTKKALGMATTYARCFNSYTETIKAEFSIDDEVALRYIMEEETANPVDLIVGLLVLYISEATGKDLTEDKPGTFFTSLSFNSTKAFDKLYKAVADSAADIFHESSGSSEVLERLMKVAEEVIAELS